MNENVLWLHDRDRPLGRYHDKLLSLIAAGKIGQRGLQDVTVRHDDWCPIFDARECTCNPDILLNGVKLS